MTPTDPITRFATGPGPSGPQLNGTGSDSIAAPKPLWRNLLKLARPKQWAKAGFVMVGPMYGLADRAVIDWRALVGAVASFSFAASACYVFNDLRDREADRMHPRKRRRPIASGAVSPKAALAFALALLLAGAAALALIPAPGVWWVAGVIAIYVGNVMTYSVLLKHVVILDVISLAGGFVLRVVAGCAAAQVDPSPWLLNCTFFLAMFLAFGKRLGERRTMDAAGEHAAVVRAVQAEYTDELLRMAVVVTGVATLITYAGYVQDRGMLYVPQGRYLLWGTMLPATYCLFRAVVLLEQGRYDDPTELAAGDRPFELSVVIFGLMTGTLIAMGHSMHLG